MPVSSSSRRGGGQGPIATSNAPPGQPSVKAAVLIRLPPKSAAASTPAFLRVGGAVSSTAALPRSGSHGPTIKKQRLCSDHLQSDKSVHDTTKGSQQDEGLGALPGSAATAVDDIMGMLLGGG